MEFGQKWSVNLLVITLFRTKLTSGLSNDLQRYRDIELLQSICSRLQTDFAEEREIQTSVLVGFPHYPVHDGVLSTGHFSIDCGQ
ncbi:hypothetical protein D9M68_855320 [compost metagenome]